jgi:C-terminal processing protease CtpA/Prc
MFRFVQRLFVFLTLTCLAEAVRGQSPTPNPSSAPSVSPPTRALIDSMSSTELQQAVQLIKSNYVNPQALNETELDRATLEGVLVRLGRGAILVPDGAPETNAPASPFYSDVVASHVGYVRLGDLTRQNLDAFDATLQTLPAKKADALVIDLRASGAGDFETAAEFAKRLCGKGKTLFTLRKAAGRQERTFTSDRDPAFQGLMIVLADGDTSGAAEALGAVLRLYNKALVIGAATAGRAVEYSDLKLSSGKMLRVAVGEALLPEGRQIFPAGLQPDLPVEMPAPDKREIFQQSRDKGMANFVFETERPHLNEAALLAGRNPEIEALENAQRRGRGADKANLRDPVLQRALDVVTSIGVYQRR